MQVQSLLSLRRTACDVEGISKKRALELLASLIAEDQPTLKADEIFINLIGREKLGSTGLGEGVAIPHCRIPNCTGIIGALLQLQAPIDYEAIDDKPVDLLFALIVPEEAQDAHLQTLASLAERFNQPSYLESLRAAQNSEQLFSAAVALDLTDA